jgi:hypothetical protein
MNFAQKEIVKIDVVYLVSIRMNAMIVVRNFINVIRYVLYIKSRGKILAIVIATKNLVTKEIVYVLIQRTNIYAKINAKIVIKIVN